MKSVRFFRNYLLCLVAIFSFSSEEILEKILAAYKKYTDELPQEKIYLHIDRTAYTPGERIWLKAYLVAGTEHIPSPLSRTIYVELIDPAKKLVRQIILYTETGSVSGDILVPDSITSGNYTLRAHTQWMRNSSEDYFFHRQLKILSKDSTETALIPDQGLDVQFFPEGGEWVAGFRSKLGFKAIATDGLGRKIKGRIVDNAGTTLTTFESNDLGMGFCELTPKAAVQYKVIVENEPKEYILPKAIDSGVTMAITNKPDKSDIIVRFQNNTPIKDFFLIAHTRGQVYYASRISMANIVTFVKVPKQDFNTGISQFLLIDKDGTPLCERLTFIDKGEKLSIKASSDKSVYKAREKITVTIEVKNQQGYPVNGADLSLAVTDDLQERQNKNAEAIESYLYLTSELKGYIESPGYYFNSENRDRNEALEVLLMTQGWRRFVIKDALTHWKSTEFEIEKALTIRGRLFDKNNKKVIANGKVMYLSTSNGDTKMSFTDAEGKFALGPVKYFDSAGGLLQGETKSGNRNVNILVDSIPTFPDTGFPVFPLAERDQFYENFVKSSLTRKKIDEAYRFDSKSVLLDAVEVTTKSEEISSVSSLKRLYGPASSTINISGDQNLENMQHPLQLIQGRVAGVQVTGSANRWKVTVRGVNSIISGTDPLILVNNIPMDISALDFINVKDIDAVQVYKGADTAIFGFRGANGVIAFYTKTNVKIDPIQSQRQVRNFNQTGYQSYREFYAPMYEIKRPEHVKPDRRITIYWEPLIKTDSTGKAQVIFYNHDLTTTVTGKVEGISTTGIPGSKSFQYSIKE